MRILFKGEESHVPIDEPFFFLFMKAISKHVLQWIYDFQGKKGKEIKKNGACMKKQTKGELSGCL